MRQHDGRAIPDFVHKFRRDQIHQQLHAKIDRDQQRDLAQRDGKPVLKHDEQQRNEIVDDRLRDVADVARHDGVLIGSAD